MFIFADQSLRLLAEILIVVGGLVAAAVAAIEGVLLAVGLFGEAELGNPVVDAV